MQIDSVFVVCRDNLRFLSDRRPSPFLITVTIPRMPGLAVHGTGCVPFRAIALLGIS